VHLKLIQVRKKGKKKSVTKGLRLAEIKCNQTSELRASKLREKFLAS
jgi:hypothetical protein